MITIGSHPFDLCGSCKGHNICEYEKLGLTDCIAHVGMNRKQTWTAPDFSNANVIIKRRNNDGTKR